MKNIVIKKSVLTIILILSAYQLQAASLINESLLKKVNTDGDETSCSMTGNQKFFIFSRKLKESDSSDLYYSEFKNKKWTAAKPASDLNSDSDEISPSISTDGKFIIFSSNRAGSLKSSSANEPSYDIYYSERKKGGWTKPELLFGAVNTTDDELNPFITKEGNLLYFTRMQFNNKSKSKIIKVYKKDDSWEDISTAEISKNNVADIYMLKKSLYRSGSYATGFKKGDSTNRKIFYINESGNQITELNGIKDSANTAGDEISISEISKNSIIVSSNTGGIAGSYDFFIKKISPEIKKALPLTLSIKIESGSYTNPEGIKIKVLYFDSR